MIVVDIYPVLRVETVSNPIHRRIAPTTVQEGVLVKSFDGAERDDTFEVKWNYNQ